MCVGLLEPLVLIPGPIASRMLDLALPESWSWDQWEGVLIPDSPTDHGPFCFVVGPTLRATSFKLQAASLTASKGKYRINLERNNYG